MIITNNASADSNIKFKKLFSSVVSAQSQLHGVLLPSNIDINSAISHKHHHIKQTWRSNENIKGKCQCGSWKCNVT